MNTFINEESNFLTDAPIRKSFAQTPKAAKVGGRLSLVLAGLSIISTFVPFVSDLLYFTFLITSATLAVFGFLEFNSRQNWFSTITWVISFVLLFLLFLSAVNFLTQSNSQRFLELSYFYGTFAVIVPILLMINALTAKKSTIAKSLSPLLITAFFIFSASLASSRAVYASFIVLPIGWGLLGILNCLESKK